MDTFAKLRNFFHPTKDVPDEDERHRDAVALRQAKAVALREQLKTDPSLNAKIDGITALLREAESR